MCGLKISTVCICHNEQLYPDPRILMDCCQLRFREWDIEMMTGICERVEIWNGFFRRDQWYMGVCIVLGDVYQGIADLSSLPSFCQKLHWRCCLLWAVAPWKMTIVGVCDSEWPLILVDLLLSLCSFNPSVIHNLSVTSTIVTVSLHDSLLRNPDGAPLNEEMQQKKFPFAK